MTTHALFPFDLDLGLGLDTPVIAAYHLVVSLATSLQQLFGAAAAPATTTATVSAIILFTLGVRLCLLPLSLSQVRAERARAALQPQVEALRRKYGNDPMRQQQEIGALYRAEGTSMFAGCLPALAQWPFFLVMYRLFVSVTIGGQQNVLLTQSVLAHNLTGVLAAHGVLGTPFLAFLGVLALLTVLAWWTSRRMPRVLEGGAGTALRLMPYGTVIFAAIVPLAAATYLVTTTAWTAAERALLRRNLAPAA